jgi:hypothetical protein
MMAHYRPIHIVQHTTKHAHSDASSIASLSNSSTSSSIGWAANSNPSSSPHPIRLRFGQFLELGQIIWHDVGFTSKMIRLEPMPQVRPVDIHKIATLRSGEIELTLTNLA